MVAPHGEADPLASPRITLAGVVERPAGAELEAARAAHVAAVAGLDVTLVDVNAAALEKALATVPLRAISQPIDIANLALFLASDESRTITGQSINCDAGGYMVG